MAKNFIGIDIGANRLKLALCSGGRIKRLLTKDMPENPLRDGRVVSPEAMARLIKNALAGQKPGTRRCRLILPGSAAIFQTPSLPPMTREQIRFNLPYEFKDYIKGDADSFIFDCADNEGHIIAAAALKSTVAAYGRMLRRAGLKMEAAIPQELAYINLIRHLINNGKTEAGREFCFIDLGHSAVRIHIFKGVRHQATRIIETGMRQLDKAIAEEQNTYEHIARLFKHSNDNGELLSPGCRNVYAQIAVEAMRAVNFYRWNCPGSKLNEVYLCGGGADIEPLAEHIRIALNMPVRNAGELFDYDGASVSPAAIGAAICESVLNLKKNDRPAGFYRRHLVLGAALALLLALFANFAVLKRFDTAAEFEREALTLERRYQALVEANAIYPSIADEYEKHFAVTETYADATDVLRLAEEYLMPSANVSSLSLNGNTLDLVLNGITLERASVIMDALTRDRRVGSVSVRGLYSSGNEAREVAMTVTLSSK